jgi:hypothetical protein
VGSEEQCTCEGSQSFLSLYADCSGRNRVCSQVAGRLIVYTRVEMGTVVYVRRLKWTKSCMYAGCNKVNRVQSFLGKSRYVQAGR